MTEVVSLRPAPPDLCLEFVNTRYWRGQEPPTETLHGPDDLLAWCSDMGGAPAPVVQTLTRAWQAEPTAAQTAFDRAIALREALNRLFGARLLGEAPLAADLATLETALAAAPARTRLAPDADGFAWHIEAPADLWLLLTPVLWSASDLLAGPIGAQVRRCANPECLFLFLDTSRAGNRRWCSMQNCGNRAKARRHYHKAKKAQPS